jgi:oxaloacetate decarboxylase gamma subunit
MTIAEMLGQSGIFAVMGMGTVFIFLVLVVICVNGMGKFVHALHLDKDLYEQPKKKAAVPAAGNKSAVTAAITAAVSQYRETH